MLDKLAVLDLRIFMKEVKSLKGFKSQKGLKGQKGLKKQVNMWSLKYYLDPLIQAVLLRFLMVWDRRRTITMFGLKVSNISGQ